MAGRGPTGGGPRGGVEAMHWEAAGTELGEDREKEYALRIIEETQSILRQNPRHLRGTFVKHFQKKPAGEALTYQELYDLLGNVGSEVASADPWAFINQKAAEASRLPQDRPEGADTTPESNPAEDASGDATGGDAGSPRPGAVE